MFKFKYFNFKHPENIEFIFVTWAVSKWETSIEIKEEQPENKYFILLILDVLILTKFKYIRFEHPSNI